MPLPSGLRHRIDTASLAGLVQVRAALKRLHRIPDREAPEMAEHRDLTLPGPAGPIEARLYRPPGVEAGGPGMIFFHGGGFVIGDLDTNDSFVRRLATAAGVTTLAVQYRLAPEARWPAQIDDALAAVRWGLDHAGEFGLDPRRIALAGDSAGAYLAIAATGAINAERPGTITAQVLIYPLLHVDDAVWRQLTLRDSRIVGRAAAAYIRACCAEAGASVPPLDAAKLPPAPPTLVATGGALDPVRPDAQAYVEALRGAGRKVSTLEFPALPHGFASFSHVLPAARAALEEIGAAAGRMLRALPPS